MQVVENWSVLIGTVVRASADAADGAVPGHLACAVHVAEVDEVEGFPNLMREALGRDVVVQVPQETAARAGVSDGQRVVVRVRRAGPTRVFAHPDAVEVPRD